MAESELHNRSDQDIQIGIAMLLVVAATHVRQRARTGPFVVVVARAETNGVRQSEMLARLPSSSLDP